MRSNDSIRIFRGIKLITDQIVRTHGPQTVERSSRLMYHIQEVLKTMHSFGVQAPISNIVSPDSSIKDCSMSESVSRTEVKNESFEEHSNTNEIGKIEKLKSPSSLGFERLRVSESDVSNFSNEVSRNVKMKERTVPATRIERVLGFSSLAIKMGSNFIAENISGYINGNNPGTGSKLSDSNAENLAEALCRLRGAALKLGQMLSIQDTDGMLPEPLAKALERVRQSADYMPESQLRSQLELHLGKDWIENFEDFDFVPVAAASIGQVHKCKLKNGDSVAVKVQYPGVATSILSDLQNLKLLVSATGMLPPGLFIDEIMRVAGVELAEECDYLAEARSQSRFRELISADPILSQHVYVPKVISSLSTGQIITTEFVPGNPIDKAVKLPQDVRNAIARTVLSLTIKELFQWRFMQTDPNFSNFLFDYSAMRINLIDFGASREYSKSFVDGYMQLVWAAANKDDKTIFEVSKKLGFLTGDETEEMQIAHVSAGMVVGEPFLTDDEFDFASSQLTNRISQYGSTFMKYRLTPPPSEVYSLHRKLAGAFLLCIKLKARITCRDILADAYSKYEF